MITIIIMTILSTAVIMTLNSTDIIDRSKETVSETNLQQVKELARLAWNEAFIDKLTDDTVDLEVRVMQALEDNDVDLDLYYIEVSDLEVSVIRKPAKWQLQKVVQDGKTTSVKVTNGTQSLNVGTVVNYMPNGVGPTSYKGGWQILGVDEQGRVLLLSSTTITDDTISIGRQDGFVNMESILQTAVNWYKDGEYGIAVRSIKLEDIEALSAYSRYDYNGWGMEKYEQNVTYKWKEQGQDEAPDYKPIYTYIDENGEMQEGQLTDEHTDGFTYYDEASGNWITSTYSSGVTIETITNNFFRIEPSDISSNISAYDMLYNGSTYWLATKHTLTYSERLDYGISLVDNESLTNYPLYRANGSSWSWSYPVRAVVTLAPNMVLVESKEVPGTYNIEKAR